MENISEHFAPFEREEEKAIERISAREELEKIIKFSSDETPRETEKKPQDIIFAAEDYLERISAIDPKGAQKLSELIERAKQEFRKKRLSKMGPIAKIHEQKDKKRISRKYPGFFR